MARRKKQEEEESGGDDFIVLFTALSMILLAFFIMLNTMATVDASRTRAAMNSLVGTFGSLPGFDRQRIQLELEHEAQNKNKTQGDVKKFIEAKLSASGDTKWDVEELEDGRVVVSMASGIFFNRGGYRVAPVTFEALDEIGALIVKLRVPVRIEGHADATPSKGPRSNWYLSAARAASVYRYLDKNFELPPGLVTAAGYSDTREDRNGAKRRRVEITFLGGPS